MEISDNPSAQDAGNEGLRVTRNMKINWRSTSKWALFLAILGFIYIGVALLVLAFLMPMLKMALSMTGQLELAGMVESAGAAFVVFMLLSLAAMFFIHLFHLRFSTEIKRAVKDNSQEAFEAAWRNFRNFLRFNGIITVVFIAIYLIVLIFVGSMVASQPDF